MKRKTFGEVISELDGVLHKEAFIPNPELAQKGQMDQMKQQVMQAASSLPPDQQQQVQQMLQQADGMPPEQQQQLVQQIMQQLQGGGGQAPQGADPAQQQAQGGDPAQQQQQQPDPSQAATQGMDAEVAKNGPTEQELNQMQNMPGVSELENTRVSLSVKELLDLVSGGKATASRLKVHELVDKHHTKKRQDAMKEQQMQAQEQQIAQQQQQMQQQQATPDMMSGGGIYR